MQVADGYGQTWTIFAHKMRTTAMRSPTPAEAALRELLAYRPRIQWDQGWELDRSRKTLTDGEPAEKLVGLCGRFVAALDDHARQSLREKSVRLVRLVDEVRPAIFFMQLTRQDLAWRLFRVKDTIASIAQMATDEETAKRPGQMLAELWRLEQLELTQQAWGCFLLEQCFDALEKADEYESVIARVEADLHRITAAVQGAARIFVTDLSHAESGNRLLPKSKRRATLTYTGEKPTLYYDGKSCHIPPGLGTKLVHFLYDCNKLKRVPSKKEIWAHIYPNKVYSGDTERLRTLVSRTNRALEDSLPPPTKHWIDNRDGGGYCLTDAVNWRADSEWKQANG